MPFNCYDKGGLNLGETRYVDANATETTIGTSYWQGAGYDGLIYEEWPHGFMHEQRKSLLTHKRVFISHRQKDAAKAKKFAKLLDAQGIDYWLDLFDPRLNSGWDLSPFAIANIIEIALINSTHVVAMITPNSNGSL